MEFKIKQPYLILKDRPHLKQYLEIALGEMTISYEDMKSFGRFKKAPNKEVLISKYIIEGTDLGIKYSEDNFVVAAPFNLKLEFSYLTSTPLLQLIDSH